MGHAVDNSDNQLIKVVESLPINLFPGFFTIMTHKLKYLTVNKLALDLIGYKSEDQVSGTTYDNMPCKASESAAVFIKEDQRVLESNKPIKILSYQCFNGSDWKIMIAEKMPITNQMGEVIGVMGHFIDVSDLRLIDLGRFLIKHGAKYLNKIQKYQFSYILEDTYQDLNLSDRQTECLFFLLRGKTVRLIAEILELSPRTIEGYIDEIKTKFGCRTQGEIIDKAIVNGYMNIIPKGLISQGIL